MNVYIYLILIHMMQVVSILQSQKTDIKLQLFFAKLCSLALVLSLFIYFHSLGIVY